MNEAGDLARRRIKRLTEELAQLIKRVIKIEYEILARARRASWKKRSSRSSRSSSGRAPGTAPEEIRADDEHVIWPFNGEYWRDELGYYRVKIAQQVRRQERPKGAPATGRDGDAGGPGGRRQRRRRGHGRRRRRPTASLQLP